MQERPSHSFSAEGMHFPSRRENRIFPNNFPFSSALSSNSDLYIIMLSLYSFFQNSTVKTRKLHCPLLWFKIIIWLSTDAMPHLPKCYMRSHLFNFHFQWVIYLIHQYIFPFGLGEKQADEWCGSDGLPLQYIMLVALQSHIWIKKIKIKEPEQVTSFLIVFALFCFPSASFTKYRSKHLILPSSTPQQDKWKLNSSLKNISENGERKTFEVKF